MKFAIALLALLLAAVSAHAQEVNISAPSFPFTALNVKNFGAVGDCVTDDLAAINLAIARANTLATAGTPTVIYFPAACYVVKTNALTRFVKNGGVTGDGEWKSVILIDKAYSGDLFSWSEAWAASNFPFNGTAVTLPQKTGPYIEGLTIIGDRTTANVQTVFHFYDRNDLIYMNNVDVMYVKGQVIKTGDQSATTQAFIRESYFGRIRIYNCGDTGKPVVEFYASGNGVGGTPVEVIDLNIYAPYDIGLYIHNDATGSPLRKYYFGHLRVEGLEGNPTSLTTDLVKIGDSAQLGTINGIHFADAQLIDPYGGGAALELNGVSAATAPFDISFTGTIDGGIPAGKGVVINAGKGSSFHVSNMNTTDTNVTVASSTTVGDGLVFEGLGATASWTWSVDATSKTFLHLPILGSPNGQNPVVLGASNINARCKADSTTTCGNAIGTNAVDLQVGTLGGVGQVASGANAFASGAQNNVTAQFGTAQGFANVLSGTYSAARGRAAADRGHYADDCFASGTFAATGDAQTCAHVLRGTGATASAFRLTADGGAAAAANCISIANNSAYALVVTIVAFDHTTVANNESWLNWTMLLTRGANVASTTLVAASTPTPLTNGAVTGSAIAATADTTNGCLNISFTPPTGNTDTWNAVAKVESVEVQ